MAANLLLSAYVPVATSTIEWAHHGALGAPSQGPRWLEQPFALLGMVGGLRWRVFYLGF